jgi:hypothetical protein
MIDKNALDPYMKSLSSVSKTLVIVKIFSWSAWAILFVWTAHKDRQLGWLILLCLLGTWLVVKLAHDFEELDRRKDAVERKLYEKRGEETFAAELEALEKLDKTEFARRLDEEWERIRSQRGIRYSKEGPSPYTDMLGRPLAGSVLQMLSTDRLKLIIQMALEKPGDYSDFYRHALAGHPFMASTLPSPEDLERHGSSRNATEFLRTWQAGQGNQPQDQLKS